MYVQTFEKINTHVEVVRWHGGRDVAMEILKWVGQGGAFTPATKEDPREYMQIPTIFGMRTLKAGEFIVKIAPQQFLTYKPAALVEEYAEVLDNDHHLVAHARRELEAFPNEDIDFKESLVSAVKGFTSYRGHSGGSIEMALHMITALLNGHNLLPLTNDPEEWDLRSADTYGTDKDVWQNKRNSKAISEDAGKTYFLVDELPNGEGEEEVAIKIYTSEDKDYEPEIDPADLESVPDESGDYEGTDGLPLVDEDAVEYARTIEAGDTNG